MAGGDRGGYTVLDLFSFHELHDPGGEQEGKRSYCYEKQSPCRDGHERLRAEPGIPSHGSSRVERASPAMRELEIRGWKQYQHPK